MLPFSIYAIAAALLALVLGFWAGKKASQLKKRQFTSQFGASEGSKEAKKANRRSQEARRAHVDERKAVVLQFVQEQGKVTNDDVEGALCVSDTTARNYLDELESEGKLKQVGETGRGVYYTIPG